MTVQLDIPYHTLLSLVEQLPDEQQYDLLQRLLAKSKARHLSMDERLKVLDSLVIDSDVVITDYSDRREDWYGDDGR